MTAHETEQRTLTGEEAEPVEPDPEELPEWEICIRAYGPRDEPGEARWEHYHPRAETEEAAREQAIDAAKSGLDAIIGTCDAYDVVDIHGPYYPDDRAHAGVKHGR